MGFKKDFIWGTAAASYQVEGGAFDDGRGLSIWDVFSHTPGKIYSGHNGDTACDGYHRFKEDLDIMASLGIKSYRFSVSWPRLLPQGTGMVNEKGVEFYNNLIDEMLSRSIIPCMTLYHWDLPYSLHLKGGWLNDDSPEWFYEYAKLIADRFGDRVKTFITFNEPQVFSGCGYLAGNHAPGYHLDMPEIMRIGFNVQKAHGMAVKALRTVKDAKIGITSASTPAIPLTESPEDIEAARSSYFHSEANNFIFSDEFWLDPIIKGRYPDWVRDFGRIGAPEITDEDIKLINQPVDFIGMNIYQGRFVGKDTPYVHEKQGAPHTAMNWPITEQALYWGPKFYYERYNKPIMITESGLSCCDWISLDGKVHDESRIDYLKRYIAQLKRACTEGVEVDGYYVWSILDNFEWGEGYKDRFGIVYVDYETQKRTVKESGYFYKNLIKTNGEEL